MLLDVAISLGRGGAVDGASDGGGLGMEYRFLWLGEGRALLAVIFGRLLRGFTSGFLVAPVVMYSPRGVGV